MMADNDNKNKTQKRIEHKTERKKWIENYDDEEAHSIHFICISIHSNSHVF